MPQHLCMSSSARAASRTLLPRLRCAPALAHVCLGHPAQFFLSHPAQFLQLSSHPMCWRCSTPLCATAMLSQLIPDHFWSSALQSGDLGRALQRDQGGFLSWYKK